MPTKSQVLRADPQKVLDLIAGWKTTVAALEDHAETYLGYVQRPGGSYWDGRTAEAAQSRARQDYEAVTHVRDAVDSAARKITNTISSTLMPPLANAKQIIENAESHAGVHVNEDLSISYTPPEGTSKETAEANAKTVAAAEAELKAEAAKWWTAELDVARQINDAQSAIGKDLNASAALYDSRRAMPTPRVVGQPPGAQQAVFPPVPTEPTSGPGGLADLLGGEPGTSPPPGLAIPPQEIEAFNAMAGETLRREGVPPQQIEQLLNQAKVRAQEGYGLMGNRVPQAQGPGVARPGYIDGLADRWHANDAAFQRLYNLVGLGDPGAPSVGESWKQYLHGAAGLVEQAADPLGLPTAAIKSAVTDFLTSPSPAYYAGSHTADAAQTLPGLLFGGEGAAVRAGLPAEVVTEGGAPLTVLRGWQPTGGMSWHDFDAHFGTTDARIWPANNGFPQEWVPRPAHLPAGTIIDRFGSEYGRYLAPDGTPFADRALMPESVGGEYNRYMVTGKPLPPGWQILEGPVEPWFGQTPSPGTTQYMIVGPDGVQVRVKELVDRGILNDYGPLLGR
ncbi:TNT domain-containing protein [Mycobacterium asiaticum]|nr:TNT domain-containing protein [Mycobacterium asiaticum]